MKIKRSTLASSLALVIFAFTVLYASSVDAQTLTVIHNFGGPPDGANPVAGVTVDTHGTLYGTTQNGGLLNCLLHGCGTVFQLMPASNGDWTEQVLSRFEAQGGYGGLPDAPVVLDRHGNVYGTFNCTFDCIAGQGGGIFEIVHSNGGWTDWTLADYWSFGRGMCNSCGIAFDQAGRLYGTSSYASDSGGNGAVFYLGQQSALNWYTIFLYGFKSGNDGSGPSVWFTFGANDAIYSTTNSGGASNAGTVFKVQNLGGAQWTETQLYTFLGGSDGSYPNGGVIFDSSGNLYGTTISGGTANKGIVFKLTHNSNGSWSESILYSFLGGSDAANPGGPLTFDAAGDLYGVAGGGAFGHGAVFKLTPSSGGQWTETVAYSFTGGLDGDGPSGGVIFDSAGNLYGTTVHGGAYPTCSDEPNCGGVVYKLTP